MTYHYSDRTAGIRLSVKRNADLYKLFFEEIDSHADIVRGVVADFALDGKVSLISYVVKSAELLVEINAALAERKLQPCGIAGFDAVLCMGMNDIIAQNINGFYGVVASDHNEVCRVEIDTEPLSAERIEECFEHGCLFRAGFGSEYGADAVCICGKLACVLSHFFEP